MDKERIDFIIGGVQKSGTSALYYYLMNHPDIFMPNIKELHYFDTHTNQHDINYNQLHQHFEKSLDYQIIGEATPIYFFWSPCIKRIYKYNPQIKWILVFRNPIDRAFSQWNMNRINGWEKNTFYKAINDEKKRLEKHSNLKHRRFSYISRGFYYIQITKLLEYFPIKNILFIQYEDLCDNPVRIKKDISSFLGINLIDTLNFKKINSLDYIHKLNIKEKKLLRNIYQEDIHNLENILGWNCLKWINV